MQVVEFRLLGGLDVYHRGVLLEIGPLKRRAVLAALLMNANEPLSMDRLVESVWWNPPAAARSNLRLYLAGLRRALSVSGEGASRLQTVRSNGYQVSVLPGELDIDRFGRLVDRGESALRAGRLPIAADCFEQGLRLWRGPLLDGVAYGPALQARKTRVEAQRLQVVEQWARIRIGLGQPEAVVTEVRSLVTEHPLRERLWGYLMLALCRSGCPTDALATYTELRAVLARELGTDASPELQRLHQRILRRDATLAPVSRRSVLLADRHATHQRTAARLDRMDRWA
jgi:DNA-binding SARP family transcriptional activator